MIAIAVLFALLAGLAFWLLYRALQSEPTKARSSAPAPMPRSYESGKAAEKKPIEPAPKRQKIARPADMSLADYAKLLGVPLIVLQETMLDDDDDYEGSSGDF